MPACANYAEHFLSTCLISPVRRHHPLGGGGSLRSTERHHIHIFCSTCRKLITASNFGGGAVGGGRLNIKINK